MIFLQCVIYLAMFYCILFHFIMNYIFQETLSSVVAWPHSQNIVTLKCHKGNVVLRNYTDQCEFKPKCDLKYWNQSILFLCSGKYMFNDTRIVFFIRKTFQTLLSQVYLYMSTLSF